MRLFIAAIAAAGMLAINTGSATAGMSGLAGNSAMAAYQDDLVIKTGRRRGRRLATGIAIGLGILGIIAASRAARAGHYDDYEWRHVRRCERWRRRCLNGNDRACFRFDNRC